MAPNHAVTAQMSAGAVLGAFVGLGQLCVSPKTHLLLFRCIMLLVKQRINVFKCAI